MRDPWKNDQLHVGSNLDCFVPSGEVLSSSSLFWDANVGWVKSCLGKGAVATLWALWAADFQFQPWKVMGCFHGHRGHGGFQVGFQVGTSTMFDSSTLRCAIDVGSDHLSRSWALNRFRSFAEHQNLGLLNIYDYKTIIDYLCTFFFIVSSPLLTTPNAEPSILAMGFGADILAQPEQAPLRSPGVASVAGCLWLQWDTSDEWKHVKTHGKKWNNGKIIKHLGTSCRIYPQSGAKSCQSAKIRQFNGAAGGFYFMFHGAFLRPKDVEAASQAAWVGNWHWRGRGGTRSAGAGPGANENTSSYFEVLIPSGELT